MAHVARVGELIFDPGVESSWKEVLFQGVEKRFHSKRQARVLERIGSLQSTLKSMTSTSIHRMGLGKWALFRANATFGVKRVTRMIGIKGFESHECNQELAEFAERKTTQFVADIQSATGMESERLSRSGLYLTDLMNIDGPGLLTCRADDQATELIMKTITENEALVYYGDITPQKALVRTMKLRKRLVRASHRSHAA